MRLAISQKYVYRVGCTFNDLCGLYIFYFLQVRWAKCGSPSLRSMGMEWITHLMTYVIYISSNFYRRRGQNVAHHRSEVCVWSGSHI